MALVVGRGRRAVRLVGHGFRRGPVGDPGATGGGRPLTGSCLALRRTARPLGSLGPRQSRRGVCRSLDGSGPTLSGCGHLAAAREADVRSHFFQSSSRPTGFVHLPGRTPAAPLGGVPADRRQLPRSGRFPSRVEVKVGVNQYGPGPRSARSPRADAAMVQAPPAGSTDAAKQKAAPTSAAYKDTLTCCIIVCTRDAGVRRARQSIHRDARTPPLPLRRNI